MKSIDFQPYNFFLVSILVLLKKVDEKLLARFENKPFKIMYCYLKRICTQRTGQHSRSPSKSSKFLSESQGSCMNQKYTNTLSVHKFNRIVLKNKDTI